MIGVVA